MPAIFIIKNTHHQSRPYCSLFMLRRIAVGRRSDQAPVAIDASDQLRRRDHNQRSSTHPSELDQSRSALEMRVISKISPGMHEESIVFQWCRVAGCKTEVVFCSAIPHVTESEAGDCSRRRALLTCMTSQTPVFYAPVVLSK
jgi:hypothetical protein